MIRCSAGGRRRRPSSSLTAASSTSSISPSRPTNRSTNLRKNAMAGARGLALKRPSAIPGFGLALGFTLTYLSLIVLIPLGGLVLKSATLGLAGFLEVVTGPRTLAALRLSFLTALIAAVVNAVFGVIIAWVL